CLRLDSRGYPRPCRGHEQSGPVCAATSRQWQRRRRGCRRGGRGARVAAVAVYTDVSTEELAGFLAGYDIGELLSYKGIAEGVENSNFIVHTRSGNFILTLYEKRVAASDLPFFLSLMEHLASRGLNCPQPVRNRAGSAAGILAGRPAAIVTFL